MDPQPSPPGPPTFKRSFLITAALFVALVLATLGVVAHLIFKDLSQQVITRNLLSSLAEVKRQLTEEQTREGALPDSVSRPELSPGVPLKPPPGAPSTQPP